MSIRKKMIGMLHINAMFFVFIGIVLIAFGTVEAVMTKTKINSKPVKVETVAESESTEQDSLCHTVGDRHCYMFIDDNNEEQELCNVHGIGLPISKHLCPRENVLTEKSTMKQFCRKGDYLLMCLGRN